jgi:hypothetical protein
LVLLPDGIVQPFRVIRLCGATVAVPRQYGGVAILPRRVDAVTIGVVGRSI